MTKLTEEDEGKRVLSKDGETVGMISGFRGGMAYVDPDPSMTDKIRSRLGWEHIDEDDYTLENSEVEQITEEEVRLKH
jgi:hypothetical protein